MLYLDPASSIDPNIIDAITIDRRLDVRQDLWDRVRAAFPSQTASSLRLEQSGGDHLLLIVDEHRAFRFPRAGKHGLGLEIDVLDRLRPQASIAVPAYDLIDLNGGLAAYPLIPGVPLTPARFAALDDDVGRTVLTDAVSLLKSLHALDPFAIRPTDDWPRMWSSRRFADRIEDERLPLLASRSPASAAPIGAFLDRYKADRAPRDVVLHGDLVGDHMLIDRATGRLAGVIDFGDVALGDPAHDLSGFWAYGATAAAHAVGRYADVGSDPTLLVRSRRHFTRYGIDRLYEMIVDGAADGTIERNAARLAKLLAADYGL